MGDRDRFERGAANDAGRATASEPDAPTPGKRTLVPSTPAPPAGPRQETAVQGVADAWKPLPYLERIRRSFGRHDVSNIRTTVGGEAAMAGKQLGASAYAYGERIAFGSEPNLHTAAHEAAHVVQQRGGAADDPQHEQQADAVADAVVAGRSAEHLLDGKLAAASAGPVIQRKAAPAPSVLAKDFLAQDSNLANHLSEALDTVPIVRKGPYAKYLVDKPDFESGLTSSLFANPDDLPHLLRRLVQPERLETLIDRSRGHDWIEDKDGKSPPIESHLGPASWTYFKPVVLEIVNALARRYDESIQRVFPRVLGLYVEKRNKARAVSDDPPPDALVVRKNEVLVSHPLDVFVVSALTERQSTILPGLEKAAAEIPSVAKLERAEQRAVTLIRPHGRWFWLLAYPLEATKEDVAAELFGKPEEAHRLIAMPPYFGYRARDVYEMTELHRERLRNSFLKEWRRTNGRGMPNDLHVALLGQTETLMGEETDPVRELTGGDNSDELALQVSKLQGPAAAGNHDEADLYDQLGAALDALEPMPLLLPLFELSNAPAHELAAKLTVHRDEATRMSISDLERRYAIASAQRKLLARVSVGLSDAGSKLVAAGGAIALPECRDALTEVAETFSSALVAVELPELAEPRVAEAERLLQNADITMLEARLHEGLLGIDNAKQTDKVGSDTYDPEVAEQDTWSHLEELAGARRDMRADPIAANQVAAGKVEQVDDLEFEVSLGEKLRALDSLWRSLHDADDFWMSAPASRFDGDLRDMNRALYKEFKTTVFDPYTTAKEAGDRDEIKRVAEVYRELMNSSKFRSHALLVRDFVGFAENEKRWAKIIVSIAVVFAAFELGAWAADALLLEGTSAAVTAGVVTTASQTVLEKIVLGHDPTAGGLVGSFLANVAIFSLFSKSAGAIRAAGVEADVAAATSAELDRAASAAAAQGGTSGATKVGNFVVGLTRDTVFAQVLGLLQSEVASIIDKGRVLTEDEVVEMAAQQMVAVVGIRVASHAKTGIREVRSKEFDAEIQALAAKQDEIEAAARALAEKAQGPENALGVPDRAGAIELLENWKASLETERALRERILRAAEKNPKQFSREMIEKLKTETNASDLAQLARLEGHIAIEQTGPNTYRCDSRSLDIVIAGHRSAGAEIGSIHTDPFTGQRKVTIQPADGQAFVVTEALPPRGQRRPIGISGGEAKPFEEWLDRQPPGDPELAELREMYLRDPRAAINVAFQRHGYQAREVVAPAPLFAPDVMTPPLPGEGGILTTGEETAAAIGGGAIAIANQSFIASTFALGELRGGWKAKHGHEPTAIRYNADTNRLWFEGVLEVEGKPTNVHVDAAVAPRVETYDQLSVGKNRPVGRPVSLGEGQQILRDLNAGDFASLKRVGIGGKVEPPANGSVEFGLGETSDGLSVIIVGEFEAVNWRSLPGLTPRGHTHPNTIRNNLKEGSISVPELLRATPDQLLERANVFPSPADIMLLAEMGVDAHVLQTPFAVSPENVVYKPVPGVPGPPRLEITILRPREVGTLPNGQRVFEATIEAGGGPADFREKIWVVETGPDRDGNLFMTAPSDLIATPGSSSAGHGAKTRAKTKAARPDDPRTAEEAKTDQRELERYKKPKYRNHYGTFEEWWEAKGKKWHANPGGGDGKFDHRQTVSRLADKARAAFPLDIIHRGTSIQGLKTPSGMTITFDRRPDVWVESVTEPGVVLKVYEAARTTKDGRFVPRERKKKTQYDEVELPSEFEEVMTDEEAAAADEKED